MQKIQLEVFKQKEKITKRQSAYTGLLDFQSFIRDFESLSWTIQCLDKRGKVLHSMKANEQRNFEAGFSVTWYGFSELSDVDLSDMTTLQVFAQIPLCLNMKSGKITFKDKNDSNGLNFEWRRALMTQIDNFNLKSFKNIISSPKQSQINEIVEDKLIKVFQVNRTFLFGCWNANSKVAPSNVIF